MKAFKHLKTILIHKVYVGKACFKLGLYKQGVFHDISKLSPIEFISSVKYYTGTSSPIDEEKKDKGYSEAWQHHKGRNPHHPEYWIDNVMVPGQECVALQMPKKYAYECLADWIGAGKAYEKTSWSPESAYNWYEKVGSKRRIHQQTKAFLGAVFLYMKENNCDLPSRKVVDSIWDNSLS